MMTRSDEVAVEVREHMRGGKGSVRVETWFKPADFGAKMRLCARLVLEPGCSIGSHAHDGEDEIYIVLAGRGRIEENGAWVAIAPGDAILTGKGGSHSVENDGTETLVIAAVIAQYA